MALDPALATAIAGLQKELASLSARLTQVEQNQRSSQLGNSSIENGSITFNDATGTPQVVLGLQADGSFAHASVTSQVPVAPDAPTTAPGVLSAMVMWDGVMSDGSSPLADFAGVQVHVSTVSGFTPDATTMQGGLPGPGMFGVGGLTAGATYYACLVAYNVAGNTSPAGAQATVVPQSVPQNIPPGAITGLQIQTGAVSSAQMAVNAGILGSQIANQTITGANVAAGTISTNLLTAGIVIAGVIDGTVVSAPTINGGVINGVMINAGVINAGTFIGPNFLFTPLGYFIYNGTPALGNTPAAWTSPGLADPFGNTLPATSGTTELAVQSNGVIVPAAPAAGIMAYADNIGNFSYINSNDGNGYRMGRFVVHGDTGQIFSTTAPTILTSGTVTFAVGLYHVTGAITFTGAAAVGAALFGFGGGTATISHSDGRSWFMDDVGTFHGETIYQAAGGPPGPQGSGVMTAGFQRWEYDLWLTCSVAGTFCVRGQCSINGDNFTINSIYSRVETYS
jgi:hypothetical protein